MNIVIIVICMGYKKMIIQTVKCKQHSLYSVEFLKNIQAIKKKKIGKTKPKRLKTR